MIEPRRPATREGPNHVIRAGHQSGRVFAVDLLVVACVPVSEIKEGVPVDESTSCPLAASHVIGVEMIGID